MFDWFFKKRERLPLPYTQELHCHLIPGVDDGSRSQELSLQMIRSLHEMGVERIIFTPHCSENAYENLQANVEPIYNKLVEAMRAEGLDLPVDYSFEYRMDDRFARMLAESKFGEKSSLRTLSGRYILVENAFNHPLRDLDQVVFELQCRGFIPILAHPERYLYYAVHGPKLYEQLIDKQLEFQCNILSFAGYYGPIQKKMAYWMLEQGYIKYLGSDMHHPQHVELLDKFLRSKEYAAIYDDLRKSINNDFAKDC